MRGVALTTQSFRPIRGLATPFQPNSPFLWPQNWLLAELNCVETTQNCVVATPRCVVATSQSPLCGGGGGRFAESLEAQGLTLPTPSRYPTCGRTSVNCAWRTPAAQRGGALPPHPHPIGQGIVNLQGIVNWQGVVVWQGIVVF